MVSYEYANLIGSITFAYPCNKQHARAMSFGGGGGTLNYDIVAKYGKFLTITSWKP